MDGITNRENIWIPLRDGRQLAARLWLPDGGASAPAIIEYIPYRKRDMTRPRDEPMHTWFAAHGYACLRVDMYGSGDSDGVMLQMWLRQEQDDAEDLIAWTAAQPWCSGAVALYGKSWGGYSAIQAAMVRPPALRAIVSVCAGDNRYDQALHYTGGAMLCETLYWSDSMLLFNLRPPDPAISGPDWRTKWRRRLDADIPMIQEWLRHQRRDAFWQQGSAVDDYASIQVPTMAVGGWADYLCRTVTRFMAHLSVPRWGIIGPWGHHFPQDGVPGPAIGFLQECLGFFDAHLKQGPAYAKPMLRAWMPDWHAPGPMHVTQTGRWVAEREWPSPRIQSRTFYLNEGGLTARAETNRTLVHRSPQTVGLCSPEWLSQAVPGEVPLDQREDDGKSLCFDTAALDERLEILGSPVLDLDLAVDAPIALIAARLCDVAPDGTSLRVNLGVLNLTHRDSDADPTPMVPGQRTRVRLTMPEVAHSFAPGHRIRIALSTSYWPIVWPSPTPVTLTLHAGSSEFILPVRPPDPADAELRFDPPEAGDKVSITVLEPAHITRTLTRDLMTGAHVLEVFMQGGLLGPARRYRLDPTDTILGGTTRRRCVIQEHDPLSAMMELSQSAEFERDEWQIRVETLTRMTATADTFVVHAEARAYDRGELVHDRVWDFSTPRDLV